MREHPGNSQPGEILEISVEVDSEAAEAVSELFNRYNGGGYEEDSEVGEASGGGAVIEATGFDDFNQPIDGQYKVVVKTYIKPGDAWRNNSPPDRRRSLVFEPYLSDARPPI